MDSVLSGIKILDITNVYSGPFCTMLLKNFGAEVIKVERAGVGDVVRRDAPLTEGDESGTFIILNRGKKSITLDMKTQKGREIIKKLAQKVDVLVENFSPGTMDKLGLGSKELCELNPGLIYASISAYGQTGPRRDLPGFDPVIQAMGGLTSISGQQDGPPTKCAVAIADFSTGLFTAYAILGALYYKQRTGEGQVIDMSLQDCVWQLTAIEFASIYFLTGNVPKRLGNGHPIMTPGNLYPARDGSVIISTGVLSMVHRLYTVMGRQDLIDTPLGANQSVRIKYREKIDEYVGEWTKTLTMKEIVRKLEMADVPCVAVPTFDEVCNDEQLISRDMITEVEQEISGKVKVPGSVLKLSKTPGVLDKPAPIMGEHTGEILSELLGLSEEEIQTLYADRIL